MDNLSEGGMFDCIDETARNEETLKAMGFIDEQDIREALKIAKNDINEAVSILTSDRLPRLIGPVNRTKSLTESINNNNNKHNNSNENEITMDSNQDESASQNKNDLDSVGAYIQPKQLHLILFINFMTLLIKSRSTRIR
jgi:hypothetical protein